MQKSCYDESQSISRELEWRPESRLQLISSRWHIVVVGLLSETEKKKKFCDHIMGVISAPTVHLHAAVAITALMPLAINYMENNMDNTLRPQSCNSLCHRTHNVCTQFHP